MLALFRTILQRVLVPIAMLGLGVGALVWGANHHVLEVFEEQEIEISIAPPPELMEQMDPMGLPGDLNGGFPNEPGLDSPPGMPPFMAGPPLELQKVKQVVMISKEVPESQAIFEITIGGLALLETGELKRTYTGTPPSLCPT